VDEPDATTVHGLANHLGALLLGLDVLQSEEDLPDHAYDTVRGLLDEAHAAATLVRALQERCRSGDGDGAPPARP
jgi:hypothetical protein